MNRVYTWEYRIEMPPYEKLMSVIEAFFASYPEGDYTCEKKEHYKLRFRRGAWKKSMWGLGELVPERLIKGQFQRWPVIVRVLARPSPTNFTITIHYELHLPKRMSKLSDEVQSSVDQHARDELSQLATYLAECAELDEPPKVHGQ